MQYLDLVRLCSKYTVARCSNATIFEALQGRRRRSLMHELLYPLAQGYDSVALAAMSKWAEPIRNLTSW